MSQWAIDWAVLSVTWTLGAIILISYAGLIIGLFSPAVPDKDVFQILGPNLSTATGAFITVVAALKIMEAQQKNGKPGA